MTERATLADALVDEGDNFRIAVWQGVAYCQVWRRPDVSAAEGTRFAAVMMNSLRALLTDAERPVPGVVLDVTHAPDTQGPNTLALLGEAVSTWSLAERRVALVVTPAQRAQMEAFVGAHVAGGRGAVVDEVDAAVAFASA